jgi:hypothetical protein
MVAFEVREAMAEVSAVIERPLLEIFSDGTTGLLCGQLIPATVDVPDKVMEAVAGLSGHADVVA